MLLGNAYELFMMDRCCYCSQKTVVYYRENIQRFISYVSGTLELPAAEIDCSVVDRDLVKGYILALRQTNVKNTTVNTYFRAVKAFINYCIDEGYVLPDTLRKVRLLRSDQKPIVPLYSYEVEQLDALFNCKTELGLRNYCIFHLMLDAGFRCSDVVNLQIQDVFFDKNCLQVKGKGNKYRSVLLCPQLKKSLYRYLVLYRSFVYAADRNYDGQPVFVQMGSQEFINTNTIKQLFHRLKMKSGIDRFHPHLCRHTFATSYILGGGNMEFLRIMLGHSDYETTKLYLHIAQEMNMLGADIYKLDPIFFRTVY